MATIDVSIDSQNDVTVFTVRGELTADDILKTIGEYSTTLILWDAMDGSVSNISAEDFRKISRIVKTTTKKSSRGKTAFVGRQEIDFGLGRMYEAFANIANLPIEYKTFKNVDEAKDWLGIE